MAVYHNVFALVAIIDDYEGETYLQTKRATYAEIRAWVKRRYGLHVSNIAIAQAKERCGLAKNEYKGRKASGKYAAPELTPEKEAAIRAAFIHFGLIE